MNFPNLMYVEQERVTNITLILGMVVVLISLGTTT